MTEELSIYPQLRKELIIDETGAYGEPPTPIHRIQYHENEHTFYAGFGVTLDAAILDLMDSIIKSVEIKQDDELNDLKID